ncbi:AzlC family ABC transporter permease [Pokkaliibacter sp. CJK22405]|uniref:AzlC family ABC transporter permease n=1 Tax=Pokkaliibacter sp. CJK22405 TaxID=3384615 RepID=UPI003984EC95
MSEQNQATASGRLPYVRAGVIDTLPLVLAAVPFGILYGALAQSQGLPFWAIMMMSLCVFAGAAQFVTIGLLAVNTPPSVIAITIFVLNLRHLLYAVSLMPQAARFPQRWRILLGFWLTDETFATVSTRLGRYRLDPGLLWYWLASGGFMYGSWNLCSLLGARLSQDMPDLTHWGLEVAMVVAFVGMVVPSLKRPSHVCCALTAGVMILLTFNWPNNTGLLVTTLVAVAVGLGMEYCQKPEVEAEVSS